MQSSYSMKSSGIGLQRHVVVMYVQGRPKADATDAAALGPAPCVWIVVHFCQTLLALKPVA